MNHSLQRGSASVEFIVAAIGLFIPLVALTVTTSEIAAATFAATSSARHGVRSFTRATTTQAGYSQVSNIVTLAMSDHGIADTRWSIDVECSGRTCHQRGTLVELRVSIDVPMRFIPSLPGINIAPVITVSRAATARVSVTSVNR